ncbi:chemotaxis protein CheW [Desulfobacterales bacterium HSG16]|nr:chemotaxis protein CheW [Desulfobacterales bacterium HSG16]
MTISEKYLIYIHQDIQYAMPITSVLEMVHSSRFLPFYGTLHGCIGNIEHRDNIVPVFDPILLCRAGENSNQQIKYDAVIIARYEDTFFGLAMDKFIDTVVFDDERPSQKDKDQKDTEREDTEQEDTEQEDTDFSDETNMIASIKGFRGSSLIVLSLIRISRMVKKVFGQQRFLSAVNEKKEHGRLVYRDEKASKKFIGACIDEFHFGIPVEKVLEIIEGYEVSPFFDVDPALRGLISLRGKVLACFDISESLGLPLRSLGENNRFIVLAGDDSELALCVDRVSTIKKLPVSEIQKADTVLSGEITEYVTGIYEDERGRIFILAVPHLFTSDRLKPYCFRE